MNGMELHNEDAEDGERGGGGREGKDRGEEGALEQVCLGSHPRSASS